MGYACPASPDPINIVHSRCTNSFWRSPLWSESASCVLSSHNPIGKVKCCFLSCLMLMESCLWQSCRPSSLASSRPGRVLKARHEEALSVPSPLDYVLCKRFVKGEKEPAHMIMPDGGDPVYREPLMRSRRRKEAGNIWYECLFVFGTDELWVCC